MRMLLCTPTLYPEKTKLSLLHVFFLTIENLFYQWLSFFIPERYLVNASLTSSGVLVFAFPRLLVSLTILVFGTRFCRPEEEAEKLPTGLSESGGGRSETAIVIEDNSGAGDIGCTNCSFTGVSDCGLSGN